MSENTRQRINKIKGWCLFQGHDFFTNLMRDLKSVRALWNYLMLGLFFWVIAYLVVNHADTCGNTAIMTVGTVVTAIFTNYVWAANAEKKAARQFPAYSQTTQTTETTPTSQTTETTKDTSGGGHSTPEDEGNG